MLKFLKSFIGLVARVTGSEHELITDYRDMNKALMEMTKEYKQQLDDALEELGKLRTEVDELKSQHLQSIADRADLRRRIEKSEEREQADAAKIKMLTEENEKLRARVVDLERQIEQMQRNGHGTGI